MSNWIEDGSFKYKHGGSGHEARLLFGTEWRTMLRLKCPECGMTTLVDDTIAYSYCPHCGERLGYEEGKVVE